MTRNRTIPTAIALGALAPMTLAALDVRWSTLDGGGATSTGGAFAVHATIGQHDTGAPSAASSFALQPGFWPGSRPPACPADVNDDGALNFDDLDAFIAAFLANDPLADLDGSGTINLDDLGVFVDSFLAGCP